MPTITEIIDPSIRTGQGAKGPWTLAKVRTSDNKEATAFMPIAVGDVVEIAFNADYNNFTARKVKSSVTASGAPTAPVQGDAMAEFAKQLKEINAKLDKLLGIDKDLDVNQETGF